MTTLGILALACSLAPVAPQQAASSRDVAKAPAFSAKATDGKTHTLASLTKEKTLVLYFISSTCPINAEAVRYYKSLHEAYKGKVNFVGVINGDAATFKEWQKEHGVKFPVLYDEGLKVIHSYKAIASPWIVVVDPKGEIALTQSGFSVPRLNELNAAMAKAAGVKAVALEFAGAPSEDSFG